MTPELIGAVPGTPQLCTRCGGSASVGSDVEALSADDSNRRPVSRQEASRRLGVTPETLSKYIVAKKIRAFRLGNRWMIPADEMRRLEAGEVNVTCGSDEVGETVG
jgi:excisionase family DNA binding protein